MASARRSLATGRSRLDACLPPPAARIFGRYEANVYFADRLRRFADEHHHETLAGLASQFPQNTRRKRGGDAPDVDSRTTCCGEQPIPRAVRDSILYTHTKLNRAQARAADLTPAPSTVL